MGNATISQIKAASNAGTSTFTTTALTTKPAVGDKLLLAMIDTLATTGTTITPPGGWATISAIAHKPMGSRNAEIYTYTYTQADSDANTLSWTIVQSANSAATYAVINLKEGLDLSNMVVGAYSVAAASVTTQTTTGITTSLPAGTLVISAQFEATAATETDAQVTLTTSGWTRNAWAGGQTNTILLASKTMSSAGTPGDLVSQWPNATQNRGSIMLAFPPSVAAVVHLAGRISDSAQKAVAGIWQYYDGTSLKEFSSMQLVRVGRKVSELHANGHIPVIAHRGGSVDYAEHSLRGYTQCAIEGVDALEFSIAITSDKKRFGLHDSTINRTTPSAPASYDPKDHTWAEVQAYLCSVGDGAGFGPQPYMLLDDLVAAYGKTHTLVLDPKVIGSTNLPDFYAYVKTIPDYQERVVLKYFHTGTGIADAARAMGVKSWGYAYAGDIDGTSGGTQLSATAAKWDYIGQDYGASQDIWNQTLAIAGSKPVWAHICPSTTAASTGLSKGATGLMVSGVRSVMADRYYSN